MVFHGTENETFVKDIIANNRFYDMPRVQEYNRAVLEI
jgi:hypothetical protein